MQNVYQTTNSNLPSIATGSTALASNTARLFWQIQNLGTHPLFVLMGSGGVSDTVFSFVLKGGASNDDGTGAIYSSDVVVFTGPITVAGTSPRYVAWEVAP